ncbi:MAG: HD domain-containing protein [Lachnospiraceae bacterium]|nr:HD domain-containing protein [Lachnospiraceae bacterium]
MYMVATPALQIGMTAAEDVVSGDNLIIKKGSMIDDIAVKKLQAYHIMGINITEPADYASTMLEKMKLSRDFKQFKTDYEANLMAFKVAVDSFIQKKVPFRIVDLFAIIDHLIYPNMTPTTLFSYISLILVEEDRMNYAHSLNVALIARIFSKWFRLNEDDTNTLILCGFLYDVGKFMLPNDIIWKPDKLSKMEYDLVKTHAFYGYYLLSKTSNIPENVLMATLQHHERVDGSGYPQGLPGNEINQFAKIIGILDAYEALTSARTYRRPKNPYEAVGILSSDGYTKYDASYIRNFLTYIVEELKGNNVRLNNGMEGIVVMNNPNNLSRPYIQLSDDNNIFSLADHKEVYITDII